MSAPSPSGDDDWKTNQIPYNEDIIKKVSSLANFCRWSHLSRTKNALPVDCTWLPREPTMDKEVYYEKSIDSGNTMYKLYVVFMSTGGELCNDSSDTCGFVVYAHHYRQQEKKKDTKSIYILRSGATNTRLHANMLKQFCEAFKQDDFNIEAWIHMDPELLTMVSTFLKTGAKDICHIVKELRIMQEQLPATSPMCMQTVTLQVVTQKSNFTLKPSISTKDFQQELHTKKKLQSVYYDYDNKGSDEKLYLANYRNSPIEGTILHGLKANTVIQQDNVNYMVYFPSNPSIVTNISTGSGNYYMNLSSSSTSFDDRITSPNFDAKRYKVGAGANRESVKKEYDCVIGDVLHVVFDGAQTQACSPSIMNQDVINYCKLHATDPHETVGNRYSVSLQFANDFTSNVESLVDMCLSQLDQTHVHGCCSNLSGTLYDDRSHFIQAMQQIRYPIQNNTYGNFLTYIPDTFQFFRIGLAIVGDRKPVCIVPRELYLPLKIPAHYVQINHPPHPAEAEGYGVAIEAEDICAWLKGDMEKPLVHKGVTITKADIKFEKNAKKDDPEVYTNCKTFSALSTDQFKVDYNKLVEDNVVHVRESILRQLFFAQMKEKCASGVSVTQKDGNQEQYKLDVDMVLDNFDVRFGWLMLWGEANSTPTFLTFYCKCERPPPEVWQPKEWNTLLNFTNEGAADESVPCSGKTKWNPFVQNFKKLSDGGDSSSDTDPLALHKINDMLYASFNEHIFHNDIRYIDTHFKNTYSKFYEVPPKLLYFPMEGTFEAARVLLNHPIRTFVIEPTRNNWTSGKSLIFALIEKEKGAEYKTIKDELKLFANDEYNDSEFDKNVPMLIRNVQTVLNKFFGLSEEEEDVEDESFLVVQMYDTNKLVAFAMLADLSKRNVQECRRRPDIKMDDIGPTNAYEVVVLRYSNSDPIVSRVVPDSRLRDIGVTAISGKNAFEVMINVLTQLATIYEKPCIGRVVQTSSPSPIPSPSLFLNVGKSLLLMPLNDKGELDQLAAIAYPIINCNDAHEDDFCIPALVPNTTHRIISLTLSTHICEIMLSNRRILTLPRKPAFISKESRYNGIVQEVPSKFIDPRVVLQDRKHVRCALSSAPAKGDGPSSFEGHFWIIDTWPQDVIKRLWTKLQPDDCRVFRALENDNASFALLSDDSIQIWSLSKLYDPTHPYDDRDLIQKLLQPFVRHDQLQFTPDTPYDRRVVYKHEDKYRYVPLLCNQWNGLPEVFLKRLRANPRSLVYCVETTPDPHPNPKGYARYNVVLNRFIPIQQQPSGEYTIFTTTEKGDTAVSLAMSSRKWTTDISTITTDGNVYANCGYHLVVSDSTLLRKSSFTHIKCGPYTIECPPHVDYDLQKTHIVDRLTDSKHAAYVSMGVPFTVPDTKQHLRVLLTPDCKCTMLAYTIYEHESDVTGAMQHDLSSKLSAVLPDCVVHVQAIALQEAAANAENNSSVRVLDGEKVLIPVTSAPTTGFAQRLVIATIGLVNALHDDTKTSQMTAVKDRMREVFKNKDVHIEELNYYLGIAVNLENCNATDTISSNAVIGISDQNRHITIKNGTLAIDGAERPVYWNDGAPSDVFGYIVDVNPVPNGGVTIKCRSGIERITNPTKQFRARSATTKALYYALTKLTLI